jgi:hypothetical protein
MIDWIIENFDPKTFSWLMTSSSAPRDLPGHHHGPPLVNLLEGQASDETA